MSSEINQQIHQKRVFEKDRILNGRWRSTTRDELLPGERRRKKITFRPSKDNNFAGDIIDIAAAYGPRFGGKRVEYIVVIEFEGNIYLKSKLETMEIDVAD
jgi:hypothetical protein